MKQIYLFISFVFLFFYNESFSQSATTFIKNITLIDGTGNSPLTNTNLLIRDGVIEGIGLKTDPVNAKVIDMSGKTIMPQIINAHGHLGILKGTKTASENYTRENIMNQLQKYQSYGIGAVLSMGTDYEMIFSMRDSSQAGKLNGAAIFTAGYGFGVSNGAPPFNFTASKVFRPSGPEEAMQDIQQLVSLKPDFIKMRAQCMKQAVVK